MAPGRSCSLKPPDMLITHDLPGRTILTDGRERLYFSGTSYLGMGHNEDFRALLQEGMKRYGTVYSSSRALNVQLAVYEEAENLLAELTGAPAALTFSSGYQAGQAATQRLHNKPNFLYAPSTHPAVWRNDADAVYGDFAQWSEGIAEKVLATIGEYVIVANALDPLFARVHDFGWVAQLPEDRAITLLVDDSHGLGVTGRDGGGVYGTLRALAQPNATVVVVSSLGKAFGVPGGVVLGPTDFIGELKKSPLFVAGSPVPPAYLFAFVRAQPLYQQARQQLFANVAYFRDQTEALGLFRSLDRYPVFYTADDKLAEAVDPDCVLSSFPYPHPDSALITRVIVSSLHTRTDLDTLRDLVWDYKG